MKKKVCWCTVRPSPHLPRVLRHALLFPLSITEYHRLPVFHVTHNMVSVSRHYEFNSNPNLIFNLYPHLARIQSLHVFLSLSSSPDFYPLTHVVECIVSTPPIVPQPPPLFHTPFLVSTSLVILCTLTPDLQIIPQFLFKAPGPYFTFIVLETAEPVSPLWLTAHTPLFQCATGHPLSFVDCLILFSF